MGRPKSPLTNLTSPARRPRPEPVPRKPYQFELSAEESDGLDAIARELSLRDRVYPNRSRALRIAIRELFTRLFG